jgi:cytochrome c oxidase accessory protein FixG
MVFYFVFAWFREQVCVIACPYGRLQGVLLDQHSLVVAYDYKRGEKEFGRAKFKKNEDRESSGKGDCIDCHQCVNVCPTGIDIRNGTQLECVNCTACMDACDEIMEAVKLPKKLIRHASEDQIQKEESFRFTSRLKGYTVILGIFILGFIFIITSRSEIEATLLRIPGQLYSISKDKNTIQNVYAYKFVNKTTADFQNIELKLISHQGHIYTANHQSITLKKEEIQD